MVRFRDLTAVGRLLPALVLALLPAEAGAQDRPGEPEARTLVAMVCGMFGEQPTEQPTCGAALVVGLENDRLYLVTANHVVRQGTEVANRVTVELRSLPGEQLPVEVLPIKDPDLDLGLLVIHEAGRKGIQRTAFAFNRLGDSSRLTRGSNLYSIGRAHSVKWWTNVAPDPVAVRSSLYIEFESPLGDRGQSGGGVFDERWSLVGLVLGGKPSGLLRALAIEHVLDFLRRNGLPVALTSAGTALPAMESTTTSCVTEKNDFDRYGRDMRINGTNSVVGYDKAGFVISVSVPYSFDKRCFHCRVKALSYRVSATLKRTDLVAYSGLYILDMSEVRGEMYTFEVESNGRVYLRHYRDGRDQVTLWSGVVAVKDQYRLSVEAAAGILKAWVDGSLIGTAAYDAMNVPEVPLGVGFIVGTRESTPATVRFDDYEFTSCHPVAR